MNQEQLAKALKALETFDRAAQSHGWHADQGSGDSPFKARRLWKAAKTRLSNMLKDIMANDTAALERPIVKLEPAERAALRDAFDAIDGVVRMPELPPSVALIELGKMGYTVEEWKHFDSWWVGYAIEKSAICTICEVTGKAIIEVCKPHDYAEILLPSGERIEPERRPAHGEERCTYSLPHGPRCILQKGHKGMHDLD